MNERRDFPGFSSARSAVILAAGALLFLLAACGGDDPETGSGGGDTTSASSGGGGESSGSGGNSSGSSSSSSSGAGGAGGAGGVAGAGGGGGGAPATECGNSIVENPEQCDDGNKADGDYCAADCSSVTGSCGDGVLQENETCDDGIIKADCSTFHDGGDGQCVDPGGCSPNYVLVMGQCKPVLMTDHVHIMPDNFCNITTNPTEYFVPAGQKLKLSWHNHSADIPVDVWMHYGGGYLDLQPGGIWNEQYEHCFGPVPSENYAEITACNTTIVLPIHCL